MVSARKKGTDIRFRGLEEKADGPLRANQGWLHGRGHFGAGP